MPGEPPCSGHPSSLPLRTAVGWRRLALLVAALWVGGCGGSEPTTEAQVMAILQQPRTDAQTKALADEGRLAFLRNSCNTCHVVEGPHRGAPRLTNLYTTPAVLIDNTKIDRDRSYIVRSILHPRENIVAGYPQAMSSFNRLPAQEIAALVTYLEQYSPQPEPDGEADTDARAANPTRPERGSDASALPIQQE